MMPYRKSAVAIGLLFLIATATFLAGDALILGVVDGPDHLVRAAAQANALTTGALLFFVDGLAIVGIALLIFPLLRFYNEPLALGYIGMRVAEFAAVLLLMATPLLVVSLAEAFRDGGLDASTSEHLASLFRAQYGAAMALVFLCTGAAGSILAYLLYRTKLIPRPIAGLGVVGYPALVLGTVLQMFKLLDLQHGIGLVLIAPVGVFEVVLPIWLIAKGFNTESITNSRTAYPRAGA